MAASVRLRPMRFCAGPSCSSLASLRRARSSAQRDLGGERAQLRVVLRERRLRFAHGGHVATAAPEAQHVAVFDDADHRDQQNAIEPVRPVHDVLDVAHLVAVANRFADALDIDLGPRGMVTETRADDRAVYVLDAERHHECVVALGDVAVFAHPRDLIVGRQGDRHGLGQLGAENCLGAVGDEGAIPLVAGACHVDGQFAFGHHRLQQQHRQYAQREKSLQFIGAVERTHAARGRQRSDCHREAGGERRAPRPADQGDPHQHRVNDVGHFQRRCRRAMAAQEHRPQQHHQHREGRVGGDAATACSAREREAVDADREQQRRHHQRAEEVAYPPVLHRRARRRGWPCRSRRAH